MNGDCRLPEAGHTVRSGTAAGVVPNLGSTWVVTVGFVGPRDGRPFPTQTLLVHGVTVAR